MVRPRATKKAEPLMALPLTLMTFSLLLQSSPHWPYVHHANGFYVFRRCGCTLFTFQSFAYEL